MTKERRLAILMWQTIKKRIEDNEFKNGEDILNTIEFRKFKDKFCSKYNLCWENNCWFCTYVHCKKCPLKSCYIHSPFEIFISNSDKYVKLNMCDIILNALKGNLKVKSIRGVN